jgi:hypothetical protein
LEGTSVVEGGTGKAEDAQAGAERNCLSGEPKENEGRRKGNVSVKNVGMSRPGQRNDGDAKCVIVTNLGKLRMMSGAGQAS